MTVPVLLDGTSPEPTDGSFALEPADRQHGGAPHSDAPKAKMPTWRAMPVSLCAHQMTRDGPSPVNTGKATMEILCTYGALARNCQVPGASGNLGIEPARPKTGIQKKNE